MPVTITGIGTVSATQRNVWLPTHAINGTRYINSGVRSAKKAELVPALG